MLTATAPAASHSRLASRSTPPEGTACRSGNGPRRCLRYPAPTVWAGKICGRGRAGVPAGGELGGGQTTGKTAIWLRQKSITGKFMVGVTRYWAPESMAFEASVVSSTVPTPTSAVLA